MILIVILLISLFRGSTGDPNCVGAISQSEYEGLSSLYFSTNGSSWRWSTVKNAVLNTTRWQFPSSLEAPCSDSWEGITCQSDLKGSCEVISLVLANKGLTGTLPSTLSQLSRLRIMEFSQNNLIGYLPSEIGLLADLEEMSIKQNGFSGVLPREVLINLKNLQTFSIGFNYFSGPLPSEIGKLSSLAHLYCNNNTLTGSLPQELGELSLLTQLYLESNNFTSYVPTSLLQLPLLEVISLDVNNFQGSLPEEMYLPRLTSLSAENNNFTGPLPLSLRNSTNLSSLKLRQNRFSGPIPEIFYNMSSLSEVILFGNLFSGSLPLSLGFLSALTELDVSQNRLIGSIPDIFANLLSLESMILFSNAFTGTLPPSMGNLTALAQMNFGNNDFSGSLPSNVFATMTSLKVVSIENSLLTGPIPTSLTALPKLKNLYLYNNSLSGPLPTSYSPNMAVFLAFDNVFTGTIPSSLAASGEFVNINIYANYLTGSIPSGLFLLKILEQLSLSENFLTGTIPSEISLSRGMTFFAVDHNSLNGTIPSKLPDFSLFYVYHNSLTGTIPSTLGTNSKLEYCSLYYNSLTGTIPTFGNATTAALVELDIGINYLTGTIPESFGYLSQLTFFYIDQNSISGSIPTGMGFLTKLQLLWLERNQMTGPIPDSFLNLAGMTQISLFSNKFSGPFPTSFSHMSVLGRLSISSNYFTGTIGRNLTKISSLISLNASSNYLEGNLAEIFDSADGLISPLQFADFSLNAFDGLLPGQLFGLPSLEVLSLFSNCFSGSIPTNICDARNVETLIIGSLTTGTGCVVEIPTMLQRFAHGVFPKKNLLGSIPDCVWSLPLLNNLQISGNGLVGTIGDIPPISNLTVLSLSHNKMTGTIPASIQESGKFTTIELSNNKFSGTLSSKFVVQEDTSLQLSVNRLSGVVPTSLLSLTTINILDGNLFQCSGNVFEGDENGLPENDPSVVSYECGSFQLNVSMLSWFCVMLTILSVFLSLRYCFHFQSATTKVGSALNEVDKLLSLWWNNWQVFADRTGLNRISRFLEMSEVKTWTCFGVVVVHILVAMLSYIALKLVPSWATKYSTHQQQYGWVLTSAYLHGSAPAALVLVYFLLTLVIMVVGIVNRRLSRSFSEKLFKSMTVRAMSSAIKPTLSVSYVHLLAPIGIQLINAILSLLVNIGYVLAKLRGNYSPTELLFIQGCVSVYKIVWGGVYTPWAIDQLSFLPGRSLMRHEVFMYLVNYIFAPSLATLFTDSNCLYFAVQGQTSIQSSYLTSSFFLDCYGTEISFSIFDIAGNGTGVLESKCVPEPFEETVGISYVPPWYYTYQCGSSLLVNYVPVLFYAYTITGVLIPAIKLAMLLIPNLDSIVPPTLGELFFGGRIYNDRNKPDSTHDTHKGTSDATACQTCLSWFSTPENRLFRGANVIAKSILDFGILVTFGLAAPTLSLAIGVHFIVNHYLWRILVGRYLVNADSLDGLRQRHTFAMLENSTKVSNKGMMGAVWLMILVASLFWSLMVFDMVSDVYGLTSGLITVLICFFTPTFLCPILAIGVNYWKAKLLLEASLTKDATDNDNDDGRSSQNSDVSGLSLASLGVELTAAPAVSPFALEMNSDDDCSTIRLSSLQETVNPINRMNSDFEMKGV